MGEVWKAQDTRLDRIVAIKLLKPEYIKHFEIEAKAIAALNHQNICHIYDMGPDYLVLEYVEGIPIRGPLKAEEAVRLAIQIAAAVEEAHGRGVLHRDLKPGNILVTTRGAIKLLDFGLAKVISETHPDSTFSMEGRLVGTPAYMSPEQAHGKTPVDRRSDVFSFGAVLYEMLAGKPAFTGNSAAEVLTAVLRDEPPPIESTPELQHIVFRCLRKRPVERYQTFCEVRAALELCSSISRDVSTRTNSKQDSIAVLPFENMSSSIDEEYFSDGLAEEILNLLTQNPELKVIARTSSFSFRGDRHDIAKIADALGVRTIVTGSVRRAGGNRIRVTAQLLDPTTRLQLWSERYDRQLKDVFAVQDEIASAICGALQLKLATDSSVVRPYKPNPQSWQEYAKGRYYLFKATPDAIERARKCFERAIALDTSYAVPHTGLGAIYLFYALSGVRPSHELLPHVRVAAKRA